jgi:hypothetical protein
MKIIAIWSGVAAIAFMAIGLQMGLVGTGRPEGDEPTKEDEPDPTPKVLPKFPDDLAPAARAKPVAAAAQYKPGSDAHPIAFLRLNGTLHPWQETVREDWQAETVSTTELVVVVGTPKKIFVSYHTYPNGAPPITRYLFELEISVIEARTGKILANRLFRNTPRPLMPVEAWETTAIGRAVSLNQVFSWVSRMSKSGFPEGHDSTPISMQVD